MNNSEFKKLYNDEKFKKSIEKYTYSKYKTAQRIFDSAAIDFNDVKQEVWTGISKSEPDKPIEYYIHVVKCDIKDYIEYAAKKYIRTVEYESIDNDAKDDDILFDVTQFVAVKKRFNDSGHVHIANGYNSEKTCCGMPWGDDVAYDIPDEITCPKCREVYFSTIKLVAK